MPTCGCGDCDENDNNSMDRGVGVLWRGKCGREAKFKGVWGMLCGGVDTVHLSGPTHFAKNMPTCECCDCDEYDNNSMLRRVGVLWRRKDGCEAKIKGCAGCFVVELICYMFSSLCYKYANLWLLLL